MKKILNLAILLLLVILVGCNDSNNKAIVLQNFGQLEFKEGIYFYKDKPFTGHVAKQQHKKSENFNMRELSDILNSYPGSITIFNNGQISQVRIAELVVFSRNDGKISKILNYENGEKAGHFKKYQDENILKSEGTYKTIEVDSSDLTSKESINIKKAVLDGVHKTYYENGNIEKEENYKYGILDGVWRRYSKYNSYKEEEGNYVNGEKQGIWRGFNEDSSISYEVNYINGKKEGVYKSYYSDGKIYKEENYKNGRLDGMQTSYHSNGKLKWKGLWNNGKREGFHLENAENGDKVSEENYENGEYHGVVKEYYDGRIREITHYKNGIKDGVYQYYAGGHSLSIDGVYRNGKKEGNWKRFRDEGVLAEEEFYINGVGEGIHRSYNWYGKIESEMPYRNGILHGIVKEYVYKNDGKILEFEHGGNYIDGIKDGFHVDYSDWDNLSKGNYKNGIKTGTWEFYDSEGNLEKESVYENGYEISKEKY